MNKLKFLGEKNKKIFEFKFGVLFVCVAITSLSSWYFTKDSPSFEKVMSIVQVGITFSALIYTALSITASAEAKNEYTLANKKPAGNKDDF